MKPVLANEAPSNVIVSITKQGYPSEITGVGSFDTFIYFSYSGRMYAVEAYQNGTYSEPRGF